jgi:hypothetical protein
MRLALLTVLALTGCRVDDGPSSSVAIASRPGKLEISGCANGGLLSCETIEQGWVDKMQVGIDGVRLDVPRYKPPPFELFSSREFELEVPSPEDPMIWVRLNSRSTEVGELPWFDIDWAPTTHRGDGPFRLAFQVFPEAEVLVELTSRCPGRGDQTRSYGDLGGEDGRVDLPLAALGLDGACTHDAALTQTIRDLDDKLDAWVEVSRTENLSFTSTD